MNSFKVGSFPLSQIYIPNFPLYWGLTSTDHWEGKDGKDEKKMSSGRSPMPRSSDQLWSQNLPPSPLHLLQLLLSLMLHKSTRLTAWHHWWSVSLMGSDSGEKDCDAGTEEGGEGPGWQAAYWNQTFSQQADPLLLLLLTLSVDTRTFCPWQVQVPSFAPPPSCNQLPDARLVSFAGNLLVRGACTIPSTSFAMTSNVLCKSLNSCATKILTFFLGEASSGKIDVFLLSKDNFL